MTAPARLAVALDDFEAMVRRSTELADDPIHDNRKEGIARRRATTEMVTQLGAIGENVFQASPRRKEFHDQFNRMRSARMLHQASWPVVCIDREDDHYIASLQTTRDATNAFISWVRRELSRVE